MSRLVSVAVPVPALDLLTYRVPDDLPTPPPGARVLVPLGSRVVTGCVTGSPGAAPPDATLRDVLDVLDAAPFLPPAVTALALWVAEYYACGAGEAMAAAMPPRAWIASERQVQITDAGRAADAGGIERDVLAALGHGRAVRVDTLASSLRPRARGRRRRAAGVHAAVAALERDGLVRVLQPLRGAARAFKTEGVATLTAQGHDVAERPGADGPDTAAALRLGARQRAALDRLRGAPDGVATRVLSAEGIGADTLRRLSAHGLVKISRRTVERDPFERGAADGPAPDTTVPVPTAEQEAAMGRLAAKAEAGGFHVALLHGVTGSGKTEIYRRLAERVVAGGRRVLLLVPEIALTPAVAATFRGTFGARVAIQHSGLSDGERHDQWQRIRRGETAVVVGTRSAVFAPLEQVGLIVVDEEHDGSYKQEDSPRYNARDVAVVRGRQEGALVVLGSATPSLESRQNAVEGRYELIALERRVLDRPLADVRIVDMREEYAAEGPDVILSRALRQGLAARLERGEQALVLLNRRGYATAVFCRQCASTLECPNCSVSLTVHRAERRARCHYCNYAIPVPAACPRCAGPYLEQAGFGTERVEQEIRACCPGARVDRLDRDAARRRGALQSLLGRFASGEVDVLVGTQMIAKGHDFPNVTLVGVISADVGLGLADFRAGERTFQLLTQVAGRAGRGDAPGEAIVQTLYPDHYSIRHACRQDYAAFFADEMRYRSAMRYPPVVALVNAVVRGRSAGDAMAAAAEVVRRLRRRPGAFRVLGPAVAPLGRLRGEHRAQLFLKGTQRRAMRGALTAVLAALPDVARRTIVDVDPLSVL